jgi:hypothetical protein
MDEWSCVSPFPEYLLGVERHYIDLFSPILTAVEQRLGFQLVCVQIGSHECWLL